VGGYFLVGHTLCQEKIKPLKNKIKMEKRGIKGIRETSKN